MEGHVELWQNFWHFSVSAFEMVSRFFAFGLQMCHCSPELLDLLTWSGNKQRSKHNNLVSIRIFERIVFKKIVNAKSVRSRGWSVGVSCTCVIAAECLHNLRGGFCTTCCNFCRIFAQPCTTCRVFAQPENGLYNGADFAEYLHNPRRWWVQCVLTVWS